MTRPRNLSQLLIVLVLGAPLLAQQEALRLPRGIAAAADSAITTEFVKSTLTWLASDEMKGRDTPSPELDAAAAGLARQFEGFGLKPAFGESWFQGPDAPDLERAEGTLRLGGRELALDRTALAAPFRGTEADVQDAALRPLTIGVPFDTDPPPAGAALLLLPAKDGEAPSRGALRTWFRALAETHPGLVLIDPALPPSAGRSFSAPVLRLPEGASSASSGEARVSFRIPKSSQLFARNVGALLPGSDPELARDVIVFSAHYDHIGEGPPVNGDGIYNGADDDASGSTAVVAIARAFAALPDKPGRSVLFLLFYGEEKGLLGSRWYCEHPALPLDRTRAVFNLEMIGRPGAIGPGCAWVTGWRHSDFGPLIVPAGAAAGVRFYDHEKLGERLFGASDNASFVRKGVPAHSISAGSLHEDYHGPGDEVDKIDIANMTLVTRGIFYAGAVMAAGGPLPRWDPDSRYAR